MHLSPNRSSPLKSTLDGCQPPNSFGRVTTDAGQSSSPSRGVQAHVPPGRRDGARASAAVLSRPRWTLLRVCGRLGTADLWSLDIPGKKSQRVFSSKGCEARATLGKKGEKGFNPNGVAAVENPSDTTPLGLAQVFGRCPQGRRGAPTLGFGTEAPWDSRLERQYEPC